MKPHEEAETSDSNRAPRRRFAASIAVSMALFSAVGLSAFRLYFVYGKSLVWYSDGITGHYPALYFFNLWLRRFFYHPELGLAMWSWTIGLGADVISTLSWGVLGDPFALVTLLFPMSSMELAYEAAYVLRVLCAGLFSLLYLRKMGAKSLPALTGSIIYVFATFLFFSTTRHAFFVSAMVFLPLLLVGVENALARKRSWTLIAAVALAAIGSFYFFYMLAIITTIYAVARYFECAAGHERWSGLLPTAFRLGWRYLLGGLLAAPILIPTLVAILSTSRGQAEYDRASFYSLWEFRTILQSLGAPLVGANSTFLGFGYLGLVLIPVLYMRPGRSALKLMVALGAVFVSLPVFGSILNGFTFPSNRWAFAWGIFLALTAALVLSDGRPFTRRELLAMCAGFAGYVALVLLVSRPLFASVWPSMALGALTIAAFAYEGFRANVRRAWGGLTAPSWVPDEWRSSAVQWVVFGVLVVNVLVNATAIQDVRYQDTLSEHVRQGSVRGRYTRGPGSLVSKLPKDEFYRVRNNDGVGGNSSMVLKYAGTGFYGSIMAGNLTELKKEIYDPTGWSSFSFDGFDDRAQMMALVGTEYYLASRDATEFVPYGFEPYASNKAGIAYRSRYALPLGFVYGSVMPRSRYELLSALDKQSAMLQAAVVDDGATPGLPEASFEREAVEVTYTVESTNGAMLDERARTLVRTKPRGSVLLAVKPVLDAEFYVELRNTHNVIQSPLVREAELLGENPSRSDVTAFERSVRNFHQPRGIQTDYTAAGRWKLARWNTPASAYYWGNNSQMVNFGYLKRGAKHVRIAPQGIGTLSFESLKVWALPMAGFPARIETLRASPLRDVKMTNNKVTGTVSSASDGVLFLSIPYSEGWSATVDGKPAELLRVNTAFSGLRLPAGEHDIVLRYFTPGLKVGLLMAAASVVTLLVIAVASFVRARRSKARAR